jgi:hypothetical protein
MTRNDPEDFTYDIGKIWNMVSQLVKCIGIGELPTKECFRMASLHALPMSSDAEAVLNRTHIKNCSQATLQRKALHQNIVHDLMK